MKRSFFQLRYKTKTGCAHPDAPCQKPQTRMICTTGRSPMLGVRKTVFENQHGNCLSGLVTEYPARPRKHQVPCPHRQGVGYGAFCISGTCTSLERCNTLDFVPKSCAKGAAPLWNPCSHRLWAMWIRRTESSHKGAPGCLRRGKGTSAECNNLL